MIKPFFHRITKKEFNKLIDDKRTWGFVMENFRQPTWCDYPDALSGKMGCWSLTQWPCVKSISKKYCETCDACKHYNPNNK